MKQRSVTLLEYMDALDVETRLVFEQLRQIALQKMEGPQETMDYGFPAYRGEGVFGFATRKNYIALYFHHPRNRESVERHQARLGNHRFSGETLRFSSASAIPLPAIEEIVTELFG